jgi:RimJ/RimL family protein N-acetyltransferase
VDIEDFAQYHAPALETNEARHNLILTILARAASDRAYAVRAWSLGAGGACAVQYPGWPIVLGELEEPQCWALAEQLRDIDFPGVVGPDRTASWFADRARRLGITFADPIPQQIHAIRARPRYPGVPGFPRPVTPADAALVVDWLLAFSREAIPQDPTPSREKLQKAAGDGQYLFWTVDGEPVSIAGIVRRTLHGAAISGVYTPPGLRGRGYAGSVTAALVERIYAEGRLFACLYTDLRNPFSNRCYAKIGFTPVCEAWHYAGARRDTS